VEQRALVRPRQYDYVRATSLHLLKGKRAIARPRPRPRAVRTKWKNVEQRALVRSRQCDYVRATALEDLNPSTTTSIYPTDPGNVSYELLRLAKRPDFNKYIIHLSSNLLLCNSFMVIDQLLYKYVNILEKVLIRARPLRARAVNRLLASLQRLQRWNIIQSV
jgi:hypothetical protein